MHNLLRANGIDLCTQTFGDPADPAILLVAGTAASMMAWEDAFCAGLAAGARFVIRFDHRDTGRSTTRPAGAGRYDICDLVEDAVGLLDALAVKQAHVVGASMGGVVAQLMALDYPGRVASLALISTSPVAPGSGELALPQPSLRVRVDLDDVDLPDWSDAESVVEHLVELARVRAGDARPFDEPASRGLASRIVGHGTDLEASMTNHAQLDYGEPWHGRLAEISVPTLIVHGDADPILPFAHGQALAARVGRAELLTLPQAGHDLDRVDWDVMVSALLRHTGLT